tara:strand:+ start:5545 stop:5670 length:126 start_codon:yes stop_codon:yes gene_type:complete
MRDFLLEVELILDEAFHSPAMKWSLCFIAVYLAGVATGIML